MKRLLALTAALALAAVAAIGAVAAAAPIPGSSISSLPEATGGPATAQPVKPTIAPRNPFLAGGPKSNIHNDTWMTDAYRRPGPLGNSLVTESSSKPPAVCGTLAFDQAGRLLSVCPSLTAPPQARIMDPVTLETLGSFDMPNAPRPQGTPLYQDFAGGGYFFLDNKDRMWVPTKTDHIYVLRANADATGFELLRDYDLTAELDTETERITSALPDFQGRIWFVSKQNGKVGVLDRKTGEVHVKQLGENIENSFAVGKDGIYIVSDTRMYRFKANQAGKPRVEWRTHYPDSGIVKPGQVDAGSGTTPTIMKGGGYVAITDNADPMNVVVYRTERKLHGAKERSAASPSSPPAPRRPRTR